MFTNKNFAIGKLIFLYLNLKLKQKKENLKRLFHMTK